MEERGEIVVNMIMAMDGTHLISHNRYDYKEYRCTIEGTEYYCMLDGGADYLRRGGDYVDKTLYEGDDFKTIRRFLCRGGRGKGRTSPLKYTPLCDIDDDWLETLIEYEEEYRPDNKYLKYYKEEQQYRKKI